MASSPEPEKTKLTLGAKFFVVPIFLAAVMLISGCDSEKTPAEKPQDGKEKEKIIEQPTRPLLTVKDGSHDFSIGDSNFKGLKQSELKEALQKYSKDHPDVEYEFLTEFKRIPKDSDTLIALFKDAGVTLRHYWAPVSLSWAQNSSTRNMTDMWILRLQAREMPQQPSR